MGFCKQFSEREGLIVAVRGCQVERVQRILAGEEEAQGKPGKSLVNYACRETGETPLYVAALHGQVDIVCELLRCNADTERVAFDGGRTPLHVAAQYGHSEVVRMLLEAGADSTAVTSSPFVSMSLPPVRIPAGADVLDMAQLSPNAEVVTLVLEDIKHKELWDVFLRLRWLRESNRAHLKPTADACGQYFDRLLTLRLVLDDATSHGVLGMVLGFMFPK